MIPVDFRCPRVSLKVGKVRNCGGEGAGQVVALGEDGG